MALPKKPRGAGLDKESRPTTPTRPKPAKKKAKKKYAARKAIADEERIEVALERFEPLSRGEEQPTPIADLSKRHSRAEAVITKMVRSAFQKRLVRVVRVEDHRLDMLRLKDHEEELERRFDLKTAIVLDLASVVGKEQNERRRSDIVHQSLGSATGDFIGTGSFFRDGDRIGVGPGRAIHHTAARLSKRATPLNADVTLCSLAGSVGAQDMSRRFLADADVHINTLGECFRSVILKRVGHNICDQSRDGQSKDTDQTLRTTWIGKKDRIMLTHALVGVGVLALGHKFVEGIQEGTRDERLRPVHRYLEALVHICEELEGSAGEARKAYCPVGDIANHLFVVDTPKGVRVTDIKRRELDRNLEDTNARLLNYFTQADLETIENVMIVAGTVKKAAALKTILRRPQYNVGFLCTDREAAEWILKDQYSGPDLSTVAVI